MTSSDDAALDTTSNSDTPIDSPTKTGKVSSEPLIDHIENLDRANTESDNAADDADSHTDSHELDIESVETDEAQTMPAENPESTIILESVSPDVVIATLETPESEAQDTQVVSDSETSQDQKAASQTAGSDVDSSVVIADESAEITISADSIDATFEASDDSGNPLDTTEKNHIASDDTPTEDYLATETEDDDDKVQEVKEAKLESYKQFVAEQFSKQKVDYPEVRVKIEANALPTRMYFVMNILSAIIASYGLVTNSAAVVIGAMLVAMMLGPITGVALAVIDNRIPLLRKSLFTVAAGVFIVIFVGFIIGLLHNNQPLTAEILSRTQPTSMDLMIALAGGTAGAYAMVSPHLSVAVVGVAVATALVPPLAASGILFANGELTLGFGAALLALTNIIAIQFTNAMVLWILGFRRLVDGDYKTSTYLTFLRRNAVALLLLGVLGTYLTINLQTNAKQQVFESNVKKAINEHFIEKGNVLTNTQFTKGNGNQIVRAVVRGETTPSSYDVNQIEAVITQDMADNFPGYLPIKLQLRYLPVQVIESNPLIKDKLDETDAAILTN